MQPQDPMIEHYNRIYEQLQKNFDLPGSYYRGAKMGQDLAAGRSEQALKQEQLLQARLQNQYAPEEFGMRQQEFQTNQQQKQQQMGIQREEFEQNKKQWDTETETNEAKRDAARAEADAKKFGADPTRMLEMYKEDRKTAELEQLLKRQQAATSKAQEDFLRSKRAGVGGPAAALSERTYATMVDATNATIKTLEDTQNKMYDDLSAAINGKTVKNELDGTIQLIPPNPKLAEMLGQKIKALGIRITDARAELNKLGIGGTYDLEAKMRQRVQQQGQQDATNLPNVFNPQGLRPSDNQPEDSMADPWRQ